MQFKIAQIKIQNFLRTVYLFWAVSMSVEAALLFSESVYL